MAPAVLLLANSSASAAFQYVSAALNVYNSTGGLIDTVSVTEAAATNGTLYEISDTTIANSLEFGNATALTTGGSSGGPYFVTFGVIDTGSSFVLGFSWDPTGNDPYGSFANNFSSYANPPTQMTYTFDATYLLAVAGDTASFVLTAAPVVTATPEPASLAMLATGVCMLTGFGRLRRKNVAGK